MHWQWHFCKVIRLVVFFLFILSFSVLLALSLSFHINNSPLSVCSWHGTQVYNQHILYTICIPTSLYVAKFRVFNWKFISFFFYFFGLGCLALPFLQLQCLSSATTENVIFEEKRKKNLLFVSFALTLPHPALSYLHSLYISISLSFRNIQYISFSLCVCVCVCAAFHFSFVNFTLKHKHAITTIIYFSLNRIALIELLILLSVVASLIELVVYSASMLTQCGGIQLAFIPYSIH